MRILGFVIMMSVCGLNCLILDKKLPTFYIWVNLMGKAKAATDVMHRIKRFSYIDYI